ncbi:hypothetical protein RCH21_002724 [Arthrobacter sp. PL16]|uniref:hypothetical protein n=1 Tax=Arthrobacter sp. PL16 TaxID=3071720 RepID=UPI002E0252F0|nr:hypothetical protein [Arthrobacter sp. PL16]
MIGTDPSSDPHQVELGALRRIERLSRVVDPDGAAAGSALGPILSRHRRTQ